MPSRRELIAMTPEEVSAYLGEQRRIIIVTIGKDGMPHPIPMSYGVDEQGRIVIVTFRKSQKVKNLERDPRATLLVESGDAYEELKSVVLYCHVELLYQPDDIVANSGNIRVDQAMSESLLESMNEQVRAAMAKRVLLRLTPYRTFSWDHSKLAGFY
jgi:hypothetical protein